MATSITTILNELGAGFCDYALMMLIQSSILIAALVLIDLLLRRRVRAVIRYSIWMLVFVKLVLPPTLCLPTGAGYWLGDCLSLHSGVAARPDGSESGRMSVSAFVVPADYHVSPSPEYAYEPAAFGADGLVSTGMSREAVIFLVWLAGVLVLSVVLVQRIWFVRGLVAQSDPVEGGLGDKLNEYRRQVGIRRSIELRISQTALSPATCGLLRPRILLPASMLTRLSAEKLRTVLIHELAHIKRGDLWVNFAQNVLQVVYFYNPLVWLANAVVRRVREQAVDEMVLACLGDQAKSYSKTLVDIAEMAFLRPSLGLRLIGVVESRKALAGRIRHITTRPFPKTARLGVRGLAAVLIIAAVLLPMAKAQNRSTARATHPENRSDSTPKGQADTPTGKDRFHTEFRLSAPVRDKSHVSVMLQMEFPDELKVTDAEIQAMLEDDPAMDYGRAESILEEEKFQKLEDEFYQHLCTERNLEKLRENLQTLVEAHERLLYHPEEPRPRRSYWIMHRQIREELTQQEKDTLLAIYEGGQVTLEDWFETLNEMPPLKRPRDLGTVEGAERLLDAMIRASIFAVEAKSRGIEVDEKIRIVARQSPSRSLITRVYDVSILFGQPAGSSMGVPMGMGSMGGHAGYGGYGYGGGWGGLPGGYGGIDPNCEGGPAAGEDAAERALDLVELITETVEPGSWLAAGGEGTIATYEDTKLIIRQRLEVHEEIEKLLGEMRAAIPPQIAIEARFVTVSDEFLDSMGADGNSLCDIRVARHRFNSASERRPEPFAIEFGEEDASAAVGESGSPATAKSSGCLLDDLQTYTLLGAVQAHKDSKALAAPKVTVLAGESAEVRIETEHPYISGYVEPNSPSDQPEPKIEYIKTGTTLEMLARLTDDGAKMKLDIDFEISDLMGFEERLYKGQYAYQIPTIEAVSSSARVIMPDGGTVLIGGRKITVENDDGHIEEKNLLVLIKAKKVEEDQTDAEALEAIEGRGY